jgi:hypothetical protein
MWGGGVSWGEKRCVQSFWCGNPWERDTLEDLGVNRRVIVKKEFQDVGWSLDWIDLAQWRTFVKMVMNFRIPWSVWNFFTSWGAVSLSSRSVLCGLVSYSYVSRADNVLSVLISRSVTVYSLSSKHSPVRRHVAISDQLHAPTSLLPIEGPVAMEQASEPVWTFRRGDKSFLSCRVSNHDYSFD